MHHRLHPYFYRQTNDQTRNLVVCIPVCAKDLVMNVAVLLLIWQFVEPSKPVRLRKSKEYGSGVAMGGSSVTK